MDTQVFIYFQLYFAFTKSCFPCISHDKVNETGNIRINVTTRRVRLPLLPWKSNTYYIFRALVF